MNAFRWMPGTFSAFAALTMAGCADEVTDKGGSFNQPRLEVAHSSDPALPVGEATKLATAASTTPAASGRVASLPVKDGLWADKAAGACPAIAANDPAFIIADETMMFAQEVANLTPVTALGNGRFRTGSSADYDEQVIRIVSAEEISVEDGTMTGTFVWCSPETEWKPWFAE